ncbi:carboxypeptidase-like regulatory domain-containing protein [Flavobacterium hungaricum]|nr:carboxypeptidase-like regulatory domain-containing protein [Flavobacterium hungaricum]
MKNFKILFILILFSQLALAQNRIVYGIVSDSIGLPIPGANILVEGTKNNTQTDFDGCFSIKANSDQLLVFTYMGYFAKKVIASKSDIEVILQINNERIYGCIPPLPVKKTKFRNAITTIAPKDLKNANNPKHNFKNDYNNNPLIFVSDYNLKKIDYDFQIKYKISYSPIQDRNIEYATTYNKLTFKYLKKKYKKTWQSEIRKDAIGLNEFLKKNQLN